MSQNPEFICGTRGPMYQKTPKYEDQAVCNRAHDHEGPHRLYDPRSFAVIVEWEIIYEPQPRRRIQ